MKRSLFPRIPVQARRRDMAIAARLALLLGFVACSPGPSTLETGDPVRSGGAAGKHERGDDQAATVGGDQDDGPDDQNDANDEDEADDQDGMGHKGGLGRGRGRGRRDAGVPAVDAGVAKADAGSTDQPPPPADAGVSDPGSPDAGSPPPPEPAADAGVAACDPAATPPSDGHHRAGEDCASCHSGQGAPRWTLSGTLFAGVASATPVAGATVDVVDAAGRKLSLVSASNGNFWTTQAITFPVQVSASRCPSTVTMNGLVSAPASCNSCHNAGFRVHLP